jgi:transposase, IS5 family
MRSRASAASLTSNCTLFPDETTILNFRRFIEDNDLSVLILDKVNQHLSRKGLLLKTGTIVDAS